eukprot:gnl/TRDRNA2_/TRDRNA2_198315_c0_seq1.p1 gnl/TRDRNA2_/TRDRNA2_198315_c0~~gnl/TRDRNA2_/TRDRNA2_198315_c0_seq1.p1  ORF type:complete len:379 (+),score=55.61 gnl/TRDRNA2_/TRDRNA2_198315_c0_seq1:87-1223(+)
MYLDSVPESGRVLHDKGMPQAQAPALFPFGPPPGPPSAMPQPLFLLGRTTCDCHGSLDCQQTPIVSSSAEQDIPAPPEAISSRCRGVSLAAVLEKAASPQMTFVELRTPPCSPMRIDTKKAKELNTCTPPRAPGLRRKRLNDDIETALNRDSMPLLTVALLQAHCCCADHCVHEAVKQKHLRALEFLLKSGNQRLDEHCQGQRPLHVAIGSCTGLGDCGYEMAKLLLQHGARPDYCEGDSRTVHSPLEDAVMRGNDAAVALLLDHRADVNATDVNGRTALHAACCQTSVNDDHGYHEPVIMRLLSHGACPSTADACGHTPGHYVTDEKLSKVLAKAERQYHMAVLKLARGSERSIPREQDHHACWFIPEFLEIIASFV